MFVPNLRVRDIRLKSVINSHPLKQFLFLSSFLSLLLLCHLNFVCEFILLVNDIFWTQLVLKINGQELIQNFLSLREVVHDSYKTTDDEKDRLRRTKHLSHDKTVTYDDS